MGKTFTYCSVLCSDYFSVMSVLMHYKIPFEWHLKLRGCGRCYLDFTLDNEHNPALDEIVDEAVRERASRGKTLEIRIISKYEY